MVKGVDGGLEEKFVGCVVGAGVGDALGMPTEYLPVSELARLYGGRISGFVSPPRGSPCGHLRAGQYTDDTQQLMVLAESLIAMRGFVKGDFVKRVGEWGRRCLTEGGYNRFAGGTSLGAAVKLWRGISPEVAAGVGGTCGAAMRVAPVGLVYYADSARVSEVAWEAALVTHRDGVAVDAAVLVARVVAGLVRGEDQVEVVRNAVVGLERVLVEKVKFVVARRYEHPGEVARVVGVSELADETVPMALSCFLYSPDDFDETVVNAANLVPGDTDSIGCIAGVFAGARNGVRNISSRFREGVEDGVKLQELGVGLWKVAGGA